MVKVRQTGGPSFSRTQAEGPAVRESKKDQLARLDDKRSSQDITSQAKLTGATTSAVGQTTGLTTRVRKMAPPAKIDGLPKKEDAKFDHIFIGGGTAACAAAARMSENGLKVLVLEGGKDAAVKDPKIKDPIESQIPAAHAIASVSPRLTVDGKSYKVQHFSDDGENAKDVNYDPKAKGVLYPRGEKIGGSFNVNATIWVRPDDVDWNILASATGNPRWSAENMKPIFNRIESAEYRPILRKLHQLGKLLGIKKLQNPHGLGQDGWLSINRPSPKLLLGDKQLLKMVWEIGKFGVKDLGPIGERFNRLVNSLDPNDAATNMTEGLVITPLAMDSEGRRSNPRHRLFDARAKNPDNIEIRDDCKVEKVLLDKNNDAVGVRYRNAEGKAVDVGTRSGVIVSCGAFETPAVLQRSGIGNKADLESMGIACRVNSPGVGEGLSDRYEYSQVFELREPLKTLTDLQAPLKIISQMSKEGAHDVTQIELEEAAKKSPAIKDWMEGNGGALASNGALIAFQAKSSPDMDDPDLYFFLVPGDFHGYHDDYADEAAAASKLMSLVILHENKTDQQGTVKLNKDDPTGPPQINFKYHAEEGHEEDDRLPLARGIVNIGRPLVEAFGDLVVKEVWPGPQHQSIEQVAEKIGHGTWGHHANHTARMGDPSDPMTVVNGDLEVLGATNLYVADASVVHNPGSFIVSSVVAVGEVMADIAVEKKQVADAEAAKSGIGVMGLLSRQIVSARKSD